MKLKQLYTDDDAVSPVIGVILMVAITVILAAVIGTMVMDMTDSVGDAGPSAKLDVTDHSDNFDNTGTTSNAFLISHQNGDSFETKNLRVIVKESGTPVLTLDSSNDWNESSYDLQYNSNNVTGSSEVSVGGVMAITMTATDNTLSSNTEYTVQVIHTSSEKTLVESEVTLK